MSRSFTSSPAYSENLRRLLRNQEQAKQLLAGILANRGTANFNLQVGNRQLGVSSVSPVTVTTTDYEKK